MKIPLQKYFYILAKYLRFQKLHFFLLALLVLGSTGLQIFNPQVMRYFIDSITEGKPLSTADCICCCYICGGSRGLESDKCSKGRSDNTLS